MTETPVFDFTSGGAAAEDFKKKEDAARAASRGRTQFLSSLLKDDGDNEIIRFMFECEQMDINGKKYDPNGTVPLDPATGWIWTKQHVMTKTKAAPRDIPEDKKGSWPEKMTAICRRTPVGADQHPAFPECYIEDNLKNDRGWVERPQMHLWAGAVLREEVVGNQELVDAGRIHPSQIGKRIIIDQQDLADEVDDKGNTTGKKIWKKRYVIVNQRIDNFFSSLISSSKYYETSLDRDYRITRKGGKGVKGIRFDSTPLDPYEVTVMRDGKATTIKYDLREPEIAALYSDSGVDRTALLTQQINRKISDAFYNRFFDPRVEVSWNDGRDDDEDSSSKSSSSGPDAPPPAPTPQQQAGKSITTEPTTGPTKAALDEMRNRVLGGNQAAPVSGETSSGTPVNDPAPAPAPSADQAPAPLMGS